MNHPTLNLLAATIELTSITFHLSAEDATPGPKPAVGNAGGNRPARAVTILKEPADWRLENLPIPPGFAPDIKLSGVEEIRFAPGMFDTASSSYFTYIVAIIADGAPPMGEAEIQDFLEKYYRGLSLSRGRRPGFSPDPSEMRAKVTAAPSAPDAKNRYAGEVIFFDSFTDGRKVKLNVEAQVIPQPAAKRTCLLLLVSPSAKESAEWQTLHELGKKAASNAEH